MGLLDSVRVLDLHGLLTRPTEPAARNHGFNRRELFIDSWRVCHFLEVRGHGTHGGGTE